MINQDIRFNELTFQQMEDFPSFQDYRKLVCYTRPMGIFLDYLYHFPYLRLWLCDSFDITLANGEIQSSREALEIFLNHHKAYERDKVAVEEFDLINYLEVNQTDSNIIFVPYFNIVNGIKLASTIIVEHFNSQTRKALASNLRKDDFYLRKEISVESLSQKIYDYKGIVEIEMMNFPQSLLSLAKREPRDIVEENKLVEYFNLKVKKLSKQFRRPGRDVLLPFLEEKSKKLDEYIKLANDGFQDILMHKVWHDILFGYNPITAFVKCAFESNVLYMFIEKESSLQTYEIAKKIRQKEDIVKNMALLFGSVPSQRNWERFYKNVVDTIELYIKMEDLILGVET